MAALPENDRIAGPFIAVAGQTDFPADFPLIKAEGLRARRERAGVSVILSGAALSAVDPAGGGFTCRLASPALAGDRYWIYSELAPARLRQHTPNGAVRSVTLEDDAMELQAQLQEHRALLDLALTAPPGDAPLYLPGQNERADRFLTFGSDGRVRTVVRPTDFSALGALQKDAGNLYDDAERKAFRDAAGIRSAFDAPIERLDRSAIPGVRVGVKYRISDGEADGEFIGGIWGPANYAKYFFEAKFTPANTTPGESPASALFVYAENAGTDKDVVGLMSVAWASAPGGALFAGNLIAASNLLSPEKYVALELDVVPPAGGDAAPGSGGIYLNCFNDATGCGPAMQTGGVGGGKWTNGIVIDQVLASGTGLAGAAGTSLGSLWNSGAANYANNAAGVLSNGHRLQLSGPASSHAYLYADSSATTRLVAPNGVVVRNAADTASVFALGSAGQMAVGENAALGGAYFSELSCTINADGVGIAQFTNPSGAGAMQVSVANGAAGNAAAAAVRIRANGATGRSINAGGTINASGADYAEYERRADGMLAAGRSFAKGDIVGFDADGRLTDRWAEAVSFGVKSTRPALVGGDEVFGDLPDAPPAPIFEAPAYAGAPDPGPLPGQPDHDPDYGRLRGVVITAAMAVKAACEGLAKDDVSAREAVMAAHWTPDVQQAASEIEAMRARRRQAQEIADWDWHAAFLQFEHDAALHAEAVSQARDRFERDAIPTWAAAMTAWSEAMNVARAPFDRIAYCGKVPVNVTGATPGQYLVPVADPDGGIAARLVDPADMTPFDLLARLGRVRRVLPDGRAEIVVSVG